MTLPDERYRAIKCTKDFLYSLMSSNETPRVPKVIRQRAHSLLRHFPNDYELEMLAKSSPNILCSEPWSVKKIYEPGT